MLVWGRGGGKNETVMGIGDGEFVVVGGGRGEEIHGKGAGGLGNRWYDSEEAID